MRWNHQHIQWWWNIHYDIMRFPMWRCLIILPISTPAPSEQESWTSENHCAESKSQHEKHLLIWKASTWKTSTKVLCLWWGWNMKSSRFKMLDPTLVQIPDRCYCAHFPAKRFKSEMSKSIQLFSNPDNFFHLFLRGFSEATTLTRFSLGHKEAGAPFQC